MAGHIHETLEGCNGSNYASAIRMHMGRAVNTWRTNGSGFSDQVTNVIVKTQDENGATGVVIYKNVGPVAFSVSRSGGRYTLDHQMPV